MTIYILLLHLWLEEQGRIGFVDVRRNGLPEGIPELVGICSFPDHSLLPSPISLCPRHTLISQAVLDAVPLASPIV